MGGPDFTFRYKVRNWPAYNQALIRHGQLTLWFDERAIAAWRDTTSCNEPGRPKVYADAAIECALILKSVFHLSLRATQGFLRSVGTLMRLELPVPDYSTMSRRQAGLRLTPGRFISRTNAAQSGSARRRSPGLEPARAKSRSSSTSSLSSSGSGQLSPAAFARSR